MTPRFFLSCILIAGAGISIASAQTAASPLPEVTVTAPKPPAPEELTGTAVSDFVKAHAAPAVSTGQLARWGIGGDAGICPVTTGLTPAFNDFVSARILAVAASVGAPVQAEPCSLHNVYIIFTTDPDKTLSAMVKRDPRILGFHYQRQTRNLQNMTRPIQGWYVTTTHGWRGDKSIDEPEPLLPPESSILNQGKYPAGRPGSRLSKGTSSALVNAVVVVDAGKIVGRSIGAIADYIAVLSLTQALAPERCGSLPSILDMMLPGCNDTEALTGITASDLAFLRALYRTDLEVVLPLERSEIQNNMIRQLYFPPK
jgi:hypothetical protein